MSPTLFDITVLWMKTDAQKKHVRKPLQERWLCEEKCELQQYFHINGVENLTEHGKLEFKYKNIYRDIGIGKVLKCWLTHYFKLKIYHNSNITFFFVVNYDFLLKFPSSQNANMKNNLFFSNIFWLTEKYTFLYVCYRRVAK